MSDTIPSDAPSCNSEELKENKSNSNICVTDKAIVVVGNVDAGKSTLIGTLTTGLLDDGRGLARKSVAKHPHEIATGKTSAISTRTLKIPNGKTATLIDLCGHEKYFTTTARGIAGMWPDYGMVVVSPTRGILQMTMQHFRMLMSYNIPVFFVVTRVDMALEESCKKVDKDIRELCKTYKRTVEFMNSYYKYHSYVSGSELAKKLNIDKNMFDSMNDDELQKLKISDQQRSALNEFFNFEIKKMDCIAQVNQGLKMVGGKQTYIPIIYVSNLDGYYLDVVRNALLTVEPRDLWASSRDENANSIVKYFKTKLNLPQSFGVTDNHIGSTFYIDAVYKKEGIGLVVSGINRGDDIHVNDELYIGPISKAFVKIRVRSMHNDNREPIDFLGNHHRGCIAIKSVNASTPIKKTDIIHGMVIISNQNSTRNVCFHFDAAITVFGGHSATLRTGYTPLLHAGTIKQAAKLILPTIAPSNSIENAQSNGNNEQRPLSDIKMCKREKKKAAQYKIKSGDIEKVTFKFILRPEYLDVGTIFVFRSGDIHGVGCVINTMFIDIDPDACPEPTRKKQNKIRPANFNNNFATKFVKKEKMKKVMINKDVTQQSNLHEQHEKSKNTMHINEISQNNDKKINIKKLI